MLPCFVRCHSAFAPRVQISQRICKALQYAAPGSDLPLQLTLVKHPADWDADDYVRSNPPQPPSSGHHGAFTPAPAAAADGVAQHPEAAAAAAAGSSGGQTSGSIQAENNAGARDAVVAGPFTVKARKRNSGEIHVTGLGAHLSEGYAAEAYDVVLQEQVG